MEKQIDIIIPAYNAHNTIDKTLASIACQNISDKIKVTIVNDCSPNGDYSYFINKYKNELDIQELILSENHGPGYARQYGIDNTTYKYIMFCDADDMYSSPFAIHYLLEAIESYRQEEDIVAVYAPIYEINYYTGELISIKKATHSTWVFGSIYLREMLINNDIRFNNCSNGEDLSFNKIIRTVNTESKLKVIDYPTYYWTNSNPNRINTPYFQIMEGKIGFMENMIYASDFLTNHNIIRDIDSIKMDYLVTICSMYIVYCDLYTEFFAYEKLVKNDKNEIQKTISKFIQLTYNAYEKICFDGVDNISKHDYTYIFNFNENNCKDPLFKREYPIDFIEFVKLLEEKNLNKLKDILLTRKK